MRQLSRLAVVGLALTAAMAARPASAQLPPLQQQWLRDGAAPIVQEKLPPLATQEVPPPAPLPTAPLSATPLLTAPLSTTPSQVQPTSPATTERSAIWQSAGTVRLQALDKVNAQTASLAIKVGGSATFGSLTIVAKACVVRPRDQPADAAAFLAVTDSHPDSPGFDGWMLQTEPAASMLQHPIYDLRVTGCT
jgi:hypothetical protein